MSQSAPDIRISWRHEDVDLVYKIVLNHDAQAMSSILRHADRFPTSRALPKAKAMRVYMPKYVCAQVQPRKSKCLL
ncbi:hypothetical protein GGH19_001554 [Coemansia sp. RSA 1807]|nr:hypothetical protein GGH19_001554 [Coemansia sp. RSA 1807]